MTPFMAAFITITVPALLWLFTLSEAQRLPKGAHATRRTRLASFLLKQWPFVLLPFVLAYCLFRLVHANLPTSTWRSIGIAVFGPMLLLSWMFHSPTKRDPA